MATRAEHLMARVLSDLSKTDPDRQIVESVHGILQAHNKKNSGLDLRQLMTSSLEATVVPSVKSRLTEFFGREVDVPTPPQELSAALVKAHKMGWLKTEVQNLPKVELKQKTRLPGWKVKPEDWYWEQVQRGAVSKDTPTLGGYWVIVDGSQKPDWDGGKQMYENDPFAQTLAQLRREGKIEVPDWCRNVPEGSRFGISHDELRTHVNPAIAELLGVKPEQVRTPKEIEFNVLGNLTHPEWGETSTWEWLEDQFEDDGRLFGGGTGKGGLAHVYYRWSDSHDQRIGFRPLIVFSSK